MSKIREGLQQENIYMKEFNEEVSVAMAEDSENKGDLYSRALVSKPISSIQEKQVQFSDLVLPQSVNCANQFNQRNLCCGKCGYRCATGETLILHDTIVHGQARYGNVKCDSCDFTCWDAKHLRQHTLAIHDKDIRIYCDFCDDSFAYIEDLKIHHSNVHKRPKQAFEFRCNLCHYTSKQHRTFKEHSSNVHGIKHDIKIKKIGCELCSFNCSDVVSLKKHIIDVHHKDVRLHCVICTSTFTHVGYLKNHMSLVHGTEKPYSCEVCNFRGKWPDMTRHIASVHKKIRPHACDICDSKFFLGSQLKSHISAVHKKDKPFACENCSYTCSRLSHIKRHISLVHDNERRLLCEFCGKLFSLAGNLKVHISSIHQKKSR